MYTLLFKILILFGFALNYKALSSNPTDTVDSTIICAYSKDRPLQLHAFLDSLYKYVSGNFCVTVIYKASNSDFKKAYDLCFQDFKEKELNIIAQDNQAFNDFKPLTLSVLANRKGYVLFAVDDIIIKDYINLTECIYYLKKTGAYGFHLRLGKNISYSYAARQQSPPPLLQIIEDPVITWCFSNGVSEWRYPNSLDMSLYENNDELKNIISSLEFNSPNTFEAAWANSVYYTGVLAKQGLCYKVSKIVNIPLNITQQDWPTSYNMGYSIEQMLNLFILGYRIDINYYYKFNNSAPHCEVKPRLTSRIIFKI